jgi:elongation factor P--(R)-beta-lysine ligase
MSKQWQPCAGQDVIQLRSHLLGNIRNFMNERQIMEVDTPALNLGSIPDSNIDSVSASLSLNGSKQSFYLHTSPEAYMKRLLASGCDSIYQISKVYRDAEIGRLHQPEFTMLEWYRPDFDHHSLMDEVKALLSTLGLDNTERNSYEKSFMQYLDVNPHTAPLPDLQSLAGNLGLHEESDDRSLLLEFLFSHSVSPNLGQDRPLFLYDYPECQAALARLSDTTPITSERFELFIQGMEIANGFHELCEESEQRQRFENENRRRIQKGKAEIRIDKYFMDALQAGLPKCAGVAIGIERLLMVLSGKQHINDVMTFPIKND